MAGRIIVKPIVSEYFKPEHLEVLKKESVDFYTVGIDQSINSTGVTITRLTSSPDMDEPNICTWMIVIPSKEIKNVRDFVEVFQYDKKQHTDRKLTELEATKLENLKTIASQVMLVIQRLDASKIKGIGVEGLSINSKSSNILDLSGLNFLIRDRVTDWLDYTFNEYQRFVNVYSPMTNKARLVKGGVGKIEMWERFAEHLGMSKEIDEKKESYLFDITDSYSISRILVLEYLESFIPKVEKVVKETPFTVLKRFKHDSYNLRHIEMNDGSGHRAVISTNGNELPIKVMKSYPRKKIMESVKQYFDELKATKTPEEMDAILIKKTKAKKG